MYISSTINKLNDIAKRGNSYKDTYFCLFKKKNNAAKLYVLTVPQWVYIRIVEHSHTAIAVIDLQLFCLPALVENCLGINKKNDKCHLHMKMSMCASMQQIAIILWHALLVFIHVQKGNFTRFFTKREPKIHNDVCGEHNTLVCRFVCCFAKIHLFQCKCRMSL